MSMKYRLGAIVAIIASALLVWRFALQSAPQEIAKTGAPLANVTVPELAGDALAGEELFDENCALCHGANAAGQDGVAPPLVHVIYEPDHHGDAAFHIAAERGARAHHWPFGDMPPVKGVDREDIDRIVAYVRTLQRANGIR